MSLFRKSKKESQNRRESAEAVTVQKDYHNEQEKAMEKEEKKTAPEAENTEAKETASAEAKEKASAETTAEETKENGETATEPQKECSEGSENAEAEGNGDEGNRAPAVEETEEEGNGIDIRDVVTKAILQEKLNALEAKYDASIQETKELIDKLSKVLDRYEGTDFGNATKKGTDAPEKSNMANETFEEYSRRFM